MTREEIEAVPEPEIHVCAECRWYKNGVKNSQYMHPCGNKTFGIDIVTGEPNNACETVREQQTDRYECRGYAAKDGANNE